MLQGEPQGEMPFPTRMGGRGRLLAGHTCDRRHGSALLPHMEALQQGQECGGVLEHCRRVVAGQLCISRDGP